MDNLTTTSYTMADVKRLRELTGSGMMDCKKALTQTDGDFDAAVNVLRVKGAKDVHKRSTRTAAEGLIAICDGVMIELNCETDFVAKNAELQRFASRVTMMASGAQGIADVDSLHAMDLGAGTVGDALEVLSIKMGERIVLRRYARLERPVAIYLHKRSPDLPPSVGVLVSYTTGAQEDSMRLYSPSANAARQAAMQVAALKAKYVTRDEVPSDVVDAERRIAEQTAREEGKPEAALPKIVEGRVNGFFKDVVLTEQSSVTDSKKTVKALLDEAGVTVTKFVRFEVGGE
jgi:elongation factor Ts